MRKESPSVLSELLKAAQRGKCESCDLKLHSRERRQTRTRHRHWSERERFYLQLTRANGVLIRWLELKSLRRWSNHEQTRAQRIRQHHLDRTGQSQAQPGSA